MYWPKKINIIKDIKKAVTHPFLFLNYLKSIFLFYIKYGFKKYCELNYDNINIKIITDSGYLKRLCFPFYDKNIYEVQGIRVLNEILKKGDVFIDVGANLGYFSLIAAQIIGNNGAVYAFDINKASIENIEKNKKYNNLFNIETFHFAVTNRDGEINILKERVPNPFASILCPSEKKSVNLRSISLDSFCVNKKIKPKVIKIDVEGAELLVLRGMKDLLINENLIVLLELHGEYINKFDTKSEDIINFLYECGYFLYEIIDYRNQDDTLHGRFRKIEPNEIISKNIMCYVSREESNFK